MLNEAIIKKVDVGVIGDKDVTFLEIAREVLKDFLRGRCSC